MLDPGDDKNKVAQLNALTAGGPPNGEQSKIAYLNTLSGSGLANKDQYDKTSDLDEGLLANMDQNEYRARNQSGWRLLGNGIAQGVSKVVLGTLEGAGYLGDVQQMADLADNQEKEFGNWFSDLMKEGQEQVDEALPIYKTKEAQGFAPGDATWWAGNAESIASSLSLLIPTAAGVKLASAVGKAQGLGKIITSKLGRDVAKGVAGAFTSRYMENTMEASQVQQSTYKEAIARGMSEDQAKQASAEAAANTWYANNINLVPDFLQQMMLLRGGAAFGLGKKAAKGALPTIGTVAKQMGSEAVEEIGQAVISNEAQNAALSTEYDFFGKGFENRLGDYLTSDDTKTAAFFGAIGGGIFGTAGHQVIKTTSDIFNKVRGNYTPDIETITNEALAKERAVAIGDYAKASVIDDIAFSRLAFSHIQSGNTASLRDNLNDLAEDPQATPEFRQKVDKYFKDLDFLEERHAQLSDDSRTPEAVVMPTLQLELEHRHGAERLGKFDANFKKITSELVARGEISADTLVVAELEAKAQAYSKLAESTKRPEFAQKAAEVQKEFQQKLTEWKQANPKLKYEEASAATDKLDVHVQNIVSQQEKLAIIKRDLAKIATPEGQAQFLQVQKDKANEAKADAVIAKPDATTQELNAAKALTKNPAKVEAIAKRVAKLNGEKIEVNKAKVETAKQAVKKTAPKTSKSTIAKTSKRTDEFPVDVTDDLDVVFGPAINAADVGAGVDTLDISDKVSKESSSYIEGFSPVQNRIETETKTPTKPTPEVAEQELTASKAPQETDNVKTVLKELAGEYNLEGQFVLETNPDGTPKIQSYYYAEDFKTKTNPVSVYDIFDTFAPGLLTINSPSISGGTEVVIKREPEWPFWKSNNPEDVVYNIYRRGAKGAIGKPIAQIPSSKKDKEGNYPRTSTMASRAFRAALNKSKSNIVYTTVASKNNGDFIALRKSDGTRLTNGIEVLESDLVQTNTGWKLAKTPYNPIFAYVDSQGVIQTPAVPLMKGMSNEVLGRTEDMERLTTAQPGTTLILRTNPRGGFTPAQVDPRILNEEELSWLKDNLAPFLFEKRYEDLKTLLHIENADITDNLADYNGDNRLINIAGDIAFLAKSEGKIFWVKMNSTGKFGENFGNFMKGEPFNFQVYTTEGIKHPNLQHSDSSNPQVIADIKASFETLLQSQFKNIDKNFINREDQFTDVTGKTYPNYYEYVKSTNSISTDLPNGYSFYNATAYLEPNIKSGKANVVSKSATVEIVKSDPKEIIQEIAPAKEPKKTTKKKIDWDKEAEEGLNERFRLTSQSVAPFKVMSEKELSWMKDKFGEDFLSIAEGVDRVISKGGLEAFGYYHNAMIKLAQLAEEGSGYHEAFHFVFLTQLTHPQQEKIIKEASKKFGAKNRLAIEEDLAEDFRSYMLADGKYSPKVDATRSLFKRILDYIKNALGYKDSIERLFESVADFNMTPEQKKALGLKRELADLVEFEDTRNRLVPGMQKVNQQLEALNASTYQLIQMAMRDAGPDGSYDDILTAPGNLEKYIGELYKAYQDSYTTLEKQKLAITEGEIEATSSEIRTIAQRSKTLAIIIKAWDDTKNGENLSPGFKSELIKNLNKYGFSVQIVTEDLTPVDTDFESTEVEELVKNEGGERVHGISFFLRSPRTTLSAQVKRFLSTINEYEKNEDGTIRLDSNQQPVVSQTIFGTPKFIEFNRVYSNLTSKLAGYKDVYGRLSELAIGDTIFSAVKTNLDQRIAKAGQSIDPLPAQFFSTFRKSRYKFFTTLLGFDNGVPTAKVIDSDRRNIESSIIKEWENNAVKSGLIDTSGKVNEKKALALKASMDDMVAKRAGMTYEFMLQRFTAALLELGVHIPVQVIQKLDKSKKRSQQLAQLVYGAEAPSLEAFINAAVKSENPYTETGLVKILAEQSKDYLEDISASSFLNEKNNQVSAINLSSYITDTIAKFKDPDSGKAFIRKLQEDGFNRGNKFLEHLSDSAGQKTTEVKVFSAFRPGKFSDAKEFDETTDNDSFLSRFTAYHSNNNKSGYIYLGTLSDKAQQLAILLPKKKGNQARTFLSEVLRQTVNQEIVRISRIKANLVAENGTFTIGGITNYSKAARFLYMPELNNIPGLSDSIKDGSLDIDSVAAMEPEIKKVIDKFIDTNEEVFYRKLIAMDLVEKKDTFLKNKNLPEALVSGGVKRSLQDFFYNDLAWRLEMSKVLHGDIAFYGSAEKYFKRGYQIITPGQQMYTNPDITSANNKRTFNRGIFASSMKENTTEYLLSIAKLIDPKTTLANIEDTLSTGIPTSRATKIAVAYRVVNKTDAQSFSTIEAYRQISKGLGTWTNDHEYLFQNAWKDGKSVRSAVHFSALSPEEKAHFLDSEAELLLQPLKPFTYQDRPIAMADGSTFILKEQFKESITPLLPEWANKHTQFRELLAAMNRDRIDIMSDSEAVKVGAYGISSDLSQPIVGRQVSADDMRFPFIVPSKEKSEALAGTQLEKLIVGNIEPTSKYVLDNGKQLSGEEIVKEFHETWAKIIKQDFDSLTNKLGVNETLTPSIERLGFLKKLKKILLDELDNRDLPDNYSDALLILKDKLDRWSFNVDIDFPALGRKYEQILTNLWKKYILTQKFPGDALINLADFGVSSQETSSELKFITNTDGEVTAAEVGLPYKYGQKIGITEKNIDPETNKIIWDSLNKNQQRAMELIIYRIPTQGKNSMLPVRVAMIIPRSSGSVIMVPGEGTKQGGFDFDVDKSYIMQRTLKAIGEEETNKKASLYNKLFDIHWAILTNKAHAEELLNPLDSKVHDEMIDYLSSRGVVNRDIKNSPFSVVTDMEMEKLAKYSKAMIGVFSKFSVGHATFQTVKDKVKVLVPVAIAGDYKYDQVGRIRDDEGNMISDNHSAMQNSALDAQKDPKLGYLNITTFNAATLAYMTDLGVNQKLALSFMNQPIIRELAETFFRNGDYDLENAINEVAEAHNGVAGNLQTIVKKPVAQLTAANLDKSLTIPIEQNTAHQSQVLGEFRKYFYAAQDMSKANTALSTDTVRDMTGIAAVENYLNIIRYVTSEASTVQLSPELFDISKSPIKRVAAFYEYGVRAASKFTSQFYPYSSNPFMKVKDQIARETLQKNSQMTDKDMIQMVNQSMSSFMLAENNQLEKILSQYSPNYTNRFNFFNEKRSIVTYKDSLMKKYPQLEKNLLMQALKPDLYNDRNEVQMLAINNTHGNFDKTNLTNAWWELMTDSNSEIKQFAHDLVRFSVVTTGFKMTPTGFIDVVPVQFWNQSGLASYYSGLSTAYQSGSKSLNPSDAAKMIIRHNFMYSGLVPTIPFKVDAEGNARGLTKFTRTDPKGTHVTSFVAPKSKPFYDERHENSWSNYAKMYDKKANQWRLYERFGESNTYNEIQPLGEPGRFNQYSWNPEVGSVHPDHKNIQKFSSSEERDFTKPSIFFSSDNETFKAWKEYGLATDSVVSAGDILELLIVKETDAVNKELLSKLLIRKDLIKDISISIGRTTSPTAKGQIDIGNELEGAQIIINANAKTTEADLRRTLTHEILHAYSTKALAEPITEAEKNFGINTRRHYVAAKKALSNSKAYGLSSVYEFVSELGSNKAFRDSIRKIEKGGLWNKIIRSFRKLLGLKDTDIYTQVFEDLYKVLDDSSGIHLTEEVKTYNLDTRNLDSEAKAIFSKIKKNLEAYVDKLKRQNKDWKSAEKTLDDIGKLKNKEGLIKYLRSTIDQINELKSKLDELKSGQAQITAARIHNILLQLGSYNILEKVRDHIKRFPEEYGEVGRENKNLLDAVTHLIRQTKDISSEVDEIAKDLVAQTVKNVTSEELPLESIRKQLDIADKDVGLVRRGLDAIINSSDVVLRAIGKIVTNAKARANRRSEHFLKTTLLDAVKNYQDWAKTQGISTSDMKTMNRTILSDVSFIKDSTEVKFVNPESPEGKKILARDKNDPLRKYYEAVVMSYLESQKTLPVSLRPGTRIPSIRKSALEIVTESPGFEKLNVIKEGFIDNFRKTYDETDRKATDEGGNPIEFVPVRFISKQDGADGRMSTKEVSLDVASTVYMFISEMNNHDEMLSIIHDLELAKDVLKKREVALTKRKSGFAGLLSPERDQLKTDDGDVLTKPGVTSNSYLQLDTFLKRMVYGQTKKDEGEVSILGTKVDIAKTADTLSNYTGLRIMAGNLNIAFSNVATGEVTMLKEAVGGRWFTLSDWWKGKKTFFKEVVPYMGEWGLRTTKSKFGSIFEWINPEDSKHSNLQLGKGNTRGKQLFKWRTLNLPNTMGNLEMQGSLMMTILGKEKFKDLTGETVSLYEALEVKDGIPSIKSGYKYQGNKSGKFTDDDINRVRNKIIRLGQDINGIYNVIDSSGIKATAVGRMVLVMRGWLAAGVDARWRNRFYNERLEGQDEGYYISSAQFFSNMFGPNGWMKENIANLRYLVGVGLSNANMLSEQEKNSLTQEQQDDLADLRRANVRKFLFEMYTIAILSALAMFGWDDDDKDSFALYHIVRLRRELSTFFSPSTAWDVLRSPTVALDTIERATDFVSQITQVPIDLARGKDIATYKQGPNKGESKAWVNIQNKLPIWSQRHQFEDFDKRIEIIERGWK